MHTTNPRTAIRDSYLHLANSCVNVLHPAEVIEPLNPNYNESNTLDFLAGFDLLNNEKVFIPAGLAYYRYLPKHPAVSVFECSHTNGLASGNVLEEAVCHALCEVIERDAVSIADLCASCISYNIIEKIGESFEVDNALILIY